VRPLGLFVSTLQFGHRRKAGENWEAGWRADEEGGDVCRCEERFSHRWKMLNFGLVKVNREALWRFLPIAGRPR
jgi:hypothetical protein